MLVSGVGNYARGGRVEEEDNESQYVASRKRSTDVVSPCEGDWRRTTRPITD